MSPATKVPLAELPHPTSALLSDPVLSTDGGALTLRLAFGDVEEGPSGVSVVFSQVRAHAWRSEGSSTAWHVADAFDTVCEVVGSPWLRELQALAVDKGWPPPDQLRHFLLYVDGFGALEVVARSFRLDAEDADG